MASEIVLMLNSSVIIVQACKDGRSSHVDQLLFYGADIDAQNSSGNTPLHICSLNNQLSCARILLFRGADRTIQNRDGQDAFHAAILAGNKELADLIKNYSPNDIGWFSLVSQFLLLSVSF